MANTHNVAFTALGATIDIVATPFIIYTITSPSLNYYVVNVSGGTEGYIFNSGTQTQLNINEGEHYTSVPT